MDTEGYYTPKDVQALTGASASALRNYTRDYARWLSTEATTTPRRFSEQDLKLIAFVVHCTKERALTHEQVSSALAAGELDSFDWQPPQAAPAASEVHDTGTALVPAERLQAAQLLLADTQRREVAAQEEIKRLQEEVQRLAGELGKAQGEAATLKASRYRAPQWWRSLFGGREG